MRTTVTLDADVAAAVESARRERGVGVSAAVNDLVRIGLARAERPRAPFVQDTSPMGALIDVANVGRALEMLEGPTKR